MPNNKNIILQDILVSYYDNGKTSSPTLLYLHGWKSSKETFLICANFLSDKYRIIGIDLPGFGNTNFPDKSWDIFEYANFVIDFINKLELKDVFVIGHSMGGRIIAIIANNENIKGIIGSGPAGLPQRLSYERKFLASGVKLFKKINIKVPDSFKNIIGSKDYRNSSGIERETLVKILQADLMECISEVKKPALLIWGENDDQSPIWMAHKWHELIKNSELKILTETGHFPEVERPEETAKFIVEFIEHYK